MNIITRESSNDIHDLATLKIQTISGSVLPKIYANGLNQLPIQVSVKAEDKDGKTVRLTSEEWIEALNLCFTESDEKLKKDGHNDGWCSTINKNDYSIEVQGLSTNEIATSANDDGTFTLVMYICTNIVETRRISVSVDINGKHFTTADPPNGAEIMAINVKAMQPIDYADKRNTEIICYDFKTISSKLGWESRLTTEGPYADHTTGICKRRIVEIRPNKLLTGQEKFKNHDIRYDDITNYDVNKGTTIVWIYGANQPEEDCFNILQPFSTPCAVISKGYTEKWNLTINVWFKNQPKIDINGHAHSVDHSYYYRFCPYLSDSNPSVMDDGVPTLVLYQFIMPETAWKWKWNHVIRKTLVHVHDMYGNHGDIELIFDMDHNFDTPGRV